MNKKTKKIILDEILRLSRMLYEGDTQCDCANHEEHEREKVKLLSFTINTLVGLLQKRITISDFHDAMNGCPQPVREFYIDLLFQPS